MDPNFTINSGMLRMAGLVHNWHDAMILIVLVLVLSFAYAFRTLAKRITYVSLPKREARFRNGS